MSTKITKEQLRTFEFTHRYGGNGWAVVEDIDGNFCRVVGVSRKDYIPQALLAAKDRLTPEKALGTVPIIDPDTKEVTYEMRYPELLEKLETLRHEIKTGKVKIKETRFVPA